MNYLKTISVCQFMQMEEVVRKGYGFPSRIVIDAKASHDTLKWERAFIINAIFLDN
jgi:hypothetical protein